MYEENGRQGEREIDSMNLEVRRKKRWKYEGKTDKINIKRTKKFKHIYGREDR